jgi:hypothetical protein
MKPEDQLVTDDEWLLRRVWKKSFPKAGNVLFSVESFKPRCKGNDPDTDGISLYREACQAAPVDILAEISEQKRADNGIVRVSVAFIKSLGLTVENKPEPPIKGHVVIPELNAEAYTTEKARIAPILVKLSTQASNPDHIVRRPVSL